MRRIMHDAYGVGLAAPQIGTSNRCSSTGCSPNRRSSRSSTEVEWKGRETEVVEEGCLSLPTVHVDGRAASGHVRARASTSNGETS
jgi:peptide deformylase